VKDPLRILVYGFGNPGRQDDGLGVLLSENIEKWARDNNLECIQTDSNYQLNIEDSSRIAVFSLVIFADASLEDIEGYSFTPLKPSPKVDFTMHSVSPAFILNLCREVYNIKPSAFLLHIKGYEWEFMKDLTGKASQNLMEATTFLEKYLLRYIEKSAQRTKNP
jgi:hydrogenase maturation protease